MQLELPTHPLSIRSKEGIHPMTGVQLPSINMHIVFTPPHTPSPPSVLSGLRLHTQPSARCGQLTHPPIRFSQPQYEGKQRSDQKASPEETNQANSGQLLPPISHILADVPAPNGQHQGSSSPLYSRALPTPSLSPTTPSHYDRFPGLHAFANPTPPQSRQPSLTDLHLLERCPDESSHKPQLRPLSEVSSYRLPNPDDFRFRLQTPGQARYKKYKVACKEYPAKGSAQRSPKRDDSPTSTDVSDRDLTGHACVRPKSPIGKNKNKRAGSKRGKRCNNEYAFVESIFIVYHVVDRGLSWDETNTLFKKWFPNRTTGGIQCQYYRLNSRVPRIDSEGLLDLGPFTQSELRDDKSVSKYPYPREGGVRYRICEKKCRQDRPVPLSERFPEEIVYGGHSWILPEHQNNEKTKLAADKRAQQRAEHLSRLHVG